MLGKRFFDTTICILFFFLGWTLFHPSGLEAQEEDMMVSVAVVHSSLSERDADLERILGRMVLLKLDSAGLKGSKYDAAELKVFSDETEDLNDSLTALRSEFTGDHELFLFGRYEAQGAAFSIRYKLFNLESLEEIATSQGSGEINLFLDRIVNDTLQKLLVTASDEIVRIEERKAADLQEQAELVEANAAIEDVDGKEAESKGSDEKRLIPEGGVRYQTSLSTSYIMLLGISTVQFSFGLDTQTSFYYRLGDLGGHALQVGVSTGYLRLFPAEEYKGGYLRNFIPLGVGMRFCFRRNKEPFWYTELLIGGAFRMDLDTTVAEVLSPVLPYLRFYSGIRTLRFGDYSHLILHVSGLGLFNFYKEDSSDTLHTDMIAGLAPGAHVSWRF